MSDFDRLPAVVAKWIERFDSGCWLWRGKLKASGYGLAHFRRWPRIAHRCVYQILVGEIPAGLELDHLCRVRNCVNPAHLEPVTRKENARRGNVGKLERERTHCPQGHAYAGENLVVRSNGHRDCRECKCESERRRRQRIKARALSETDTSKGGER